MTKDYYRKQIVDLRADILKERETKKRDNARYADMIKRATTPASKASYRKNKIDKAALHDRNIESLKLRIERAKASMARCKK